MAEKIRINTKYDIQDNYEPSDSENEYSTSEKNIMEKLRKRKHQDSESEEEIYQFSDSDNNDEDKKSDLGMADSDVEGQESDDNLPDSKAWGKKKQSYYSTDYVDEDYGGFGDEEQNALMEEEEAKNIQKRLIEQLGEEDFSLNFFSEQVAKTDDKEILIKSDISQMSKRQKLQLLEKESPEFCGLIDDFKSKLTVAKDDLHPVLELVKGGKIPDCSASKFVKTNYDLILNYCTNISFYLLLKSRRVNVQNHPVIKRLFQYRQMLKKMEPIYQKIIKPQINKILNIVKSNLKLHIIQKEQGSKKRKLGSNASQKYSAKKLKLINALEKEGDDTGVSDDDEPIEENNVFFSNENEAENALRNENQSDESGFSDNNEIDEQNKPPTSDQDVILGDVEDKREITYQIAKNKGLTPHRKKEQRNPRVKHKLKFRKAKIRRKGAVREPRTEVTRYAGESSGIKANVKKSIKIK